MSTNDADTFARFPFATDAKCNQTAPVAANEVLFPALDFIAPGLAFRELGEARF
jgi:hypothetical protein